MRRLQAVLLLIACCLMAGCSVASLPSQSTPVCSWAADPPKNADAVCSVAFATLKQMAAAEMHGDRVLIHQLTPNPVVAGRIIDEGNRLRAPGHLSIHVVPSMTLKVVNGSEVGAALFLLGTNSGGKIKLRKTIYLRLSHAGGRILAVQDSQDPQGM